MRIWKCVWFAPLLVSLVGIGCERPGAESITAAPRLVETEPAFRGDAVDELRLLGQVRGEVEVQVFPQVPERILTLHVEEGDQVAEGDPIAFLDGGLATSDLAQARAAFDAAVASRDQLRADLRRIEGLVAQSAAPPSQLEQLTARLRSSEAQVVQLRAARTAAGQRRGRTEVRAPVAGVVAQLALTEGDLAAPQVPLCTVVQYDRVEVVVRPIEADYVRMRPSLPVTVSSPAVPDVERSGTIQRVSPVIDRVTRTGTVEVLVDNPDHILRPGMMAEVRVELERRPDVLMVPARSVLMTTETDRLRTANVFVQKGDRAQRVEVELGQRFRDRIEVTAVRSGAIEAGDAVVVAGQHLLRDGSRVRVRSTGPDVAATPPPSEPENG